jgi:uncharacterized membrane protein YhaH (DUF805 family)
VDGFIGFLLSVTRIEIRVFDKAIVYLRRHRKYFRELASVREGGGFIVVTLALLQTWISIQVTRLHDTVIDRKPYFFLQ